MFNVSFILNWTEWTTFKEPELVYVLQIKWVGEDHDNCKHATPSASNCHSYEQSYE